jgi:formate hydrogenlyase transcriptional activator
MKEVRPQNMSTPAANAIFGCSGQNQGLALRVWEAVSPERELQSVLAAVADALLPVVSFDGIGIVVFAREKQRRLYALHVVGRAPRSDDGAQHCLDGAPGPATAASTPSRPQQAYDAMPMRAEPYTCPDLLAKPSWYPHEFRLAAAGIRAYAALPLMVHGERVGVAVFGRRQASAYTEEQVKLLREVSRAFAVAVSNTLAYEEIRRLRDQLAAENVALREQLSQAPWAQDIVGNSKALRGVLEAIEQVADTGATVLISGETGTGKELIARAVHRRSGRAQGPLVSVNCAAIPLTLLAAELFGHERGAFTGAEERRKGRFEQAHEGTLFLDEIGELTPEMQILLLRVLQEKRLERLGGSNTVSVDVRVIAATNRDLLEAVRAGRFREDLFYRLNVFPIYVPPLRDRHADISLLVSHFAKKHGERHQRSIERIDRRTLRMFESYHWPGNIRELENLVERAVILSRGGTLRLEGEGLPLLPGQVSLDGQLREQERATIEAALGRTQGRISGAKGAAALLGMPASTLESRIARLSIDKFRFHSSGRRRGVLVMPQTGSRPAGGK